MILYPRKYETVVIPARFVATNPDQKLNASVAVRPFDSYPGPKSPM